MLNEAFTGCGGNIRRRTLFFNGLAKAPFRKAMIAEYPCVTAFRKGKDSISEDEYG